MGDSFQPIICMDYQMVARRRSVRNSDQKLRQQHETIKNKLNQLFSSQTLDSTGQ